MKGSPLNSTLMSQTVIPRVEAGTRRVFRHRQDWGDAAGATGYLIVFEPYSA